MRTASFLCLLLLSTGCDDRILLGHWEADDSKVELDFVESANGKSDYEGTGRIYLCLESDKKTCRNCGFEFSAYFHGDDSWELEGKFIGQCKEFGSFKKGFECALGENDDLICDLPTGAEATYVKQVE